MNEPRRGDFESDPDYLIAALTWLDATFPRRVSVRDRLAAWARLERERDPEWVRRRLLELIDDPSDEARAEFARLAEIFKTQNDNDRRTP